VKFAGKGGNWWRFDERGTSKGGRVGRLELSKKNKAIRYWGVERRDRLQTRRRPLFDPNLKVKGWRMGCELNKG